MAKFLARRSFPEMAELESLIQGFGERARVKIVGQVQHKDKSYPLHSVTIGSTKPEAPVLGFFGGVHGLERIGSEVVLAYMRTVLELMRWDKHFLQRLEHSRLIFMPLLNPVGILHRTRSNGNGVDLMRNSPLQAEESGGPFYRGHRFSPMIPWYRGKLGAEMELEVKVLMQVVEEELRNSQLLLTVDVHSGFGAQDRFWFPYSHSRRPFPYLAEAYALKNLLDQTYRHNFYAFEPMSRQYTIHGDPWDYMFEENLKRPGHGFFIPFCLEMGSWSWLKKNPLQLFNKDGVFHPTLPHRRNRTLRRHLTLFDFLHRAILSPEAWLVQTEGQRHQNLKNAMELWYGE